VHLRRQAAEGELSLDGLQSVGNGAHVPSIAKGGANKKTRNAGAVGDTTRTAARTWPKP
jgi:hypothetical protein